VSLVGEYSAERRTHAFPQLCSTPDTVTTYLQPAIEELLVRDPIWGEVIRTCAEWDEEHGRGKQFARHTIYRRMGRADGKGPELTPLAKAGVIKKRATDVNGAPVYELSHEPKSVRDALVRARVASHARPPGETPGTA
jgi:hypothetical protein